LPSHTQSLRSEYSKRFQAFMDDMLAKAAVAGQRLNTYTGTDYTGIENIRRQIVELEKKVKALHDSVASAKDAYTTAHSAQISSQREVVSLLERKASWTPHDLDRYTSLIRSEHLHEQGVTQAKQKLAEVERALEEARTDLEKKERRQYHEEQVWSDTIRRNSTWVTFGLMGLNILLLVSNIGIVEPWRRRRLVREVKDALDQRTLVPQNTEKTHTVMADVRGEALPPIAVAEKEPIGDLASEPSLDEIHGQTDRSPEPSGLLLEAVEGPSAQVPLPVTADIEAKPNEVALVVEPPGAGADAPPAKYPGDWQAYVLHTLKSACDDMLTLRKIEVTSIALEGAAAGLTVAGALIWLLR
ncbi:Mdm33 family-domain-containing protein, partial [Elsinoe ampelina]